MTESSNIISGYYASVQERLKYNRLPLLEQLKAMGVNFVEASYSGSCDSGSIDDIVIKPEISLDIPFPNREPKVSTWHTVETVHDHLEEFIYDILTSEYHGWEINDGAEGTLSWNIQTDKVFLAHTQFYTESNSEEIEL